MKQKQKPCKMPPLRAALVVSFLSLLLTSTVNLQARNNAPELFSQPDVDGGLVGGASLNATEFATIIQSLRK